MPDDSSPADAPQPDWPDVSPPAFTITTSRVPYGIALASLVVLTLGVATVAAASGTAVRLVLMVVAGVVALAAVSVLFRFLQAGKPQLVADAVGIKVTLTPHRVPWERVERVRILPNKVGGSARVGVVPASIDEALGARMNVDRLIRILEVRQQRDGAPFVASLAGSGVSPDEARARLTELAAGRAPVTD